MIKGEKISSLQLSVLIMGYIFGSSAIMNPSARAKQDAWLAYIIGWIGGLCLLNIYLYISQNNPGKNLIEILKHYFGNYLGGLLGLLYIWYFIHLAALVLRNFGEFFSTNVYTDTPMSFLMLSIMTLIAYLLRKGLEVLGRFSEIFVPITFLQALIVSISLVTLFNLDNFLPVLEFGFQPIIKASFSILTFPFGEVVIFLMIFPYLHKKKTIKKVANYSFLIVGLILLTITLRDLLVLGPDMFARYHFPPGITARMFPLLDLDPLIDNNLLIGGTIKMSVCIFAAVTGITELFNLKDYKVLILPVITISIGLSIWLYEDLFQMHNWADKVYPYYAIPFQIVIPIVLFIIIFFKNRHSNN